MINWRVETKTLDSMSRALSVKAADLLKVNTRNTLVKWADIIVKDVKRGKFFKYANPQPGHLPGALKGSLWVGNAKATGNAVSVDMGAAVFYDDILEHGPKKKSWPIVPGKTMVQSRVGGKMRPTKFLRFFAGGKIRFSRGFVMHWRPRSLRPHWGPVLAQHSLKIERELATLPGRCIDAAMAGA